MDEEYVLVVGSAGIDIKARPDDGFTPDTPNPGKIRNSVGGVARNIAENLARLEVPTILLTAVGDDAIGQRIINKSTDAGIDCAYVRQVKGGRTGTYLSLLKADGESHLAISDFEIMSHIDSDYLLEHEHLFQDTGTVVIDATLTEDALETVFELAQRHNIRVCADPTTPSLAGRLCPYISQIYLLVPNASETTALCGLEVPAHDRETAISVARQLVSMGAKIAVVTLGVKGLAYAEPTGSGFIRALKTHEVVDSTGAGDAFSGGVIFGLLNDVPVDEAMRLGVTAASLTLQSQETVLDDLNQELLYDELPV